MLNRIVLGMAAKQYSEKFHIPANEPIRTHFSKDETDLEIVLTIVIIWFVFMILSPYSPMIAIISSHLYLIVLNFLTS